MNEVKSEKGDMVKNIVVNGVKKCKKLEKWKIAQVTKRCGVKARRCCEDQS